MRILRHLIIFNLFILSSLFAQGTVYWNVAQKIRDEGIHHSHIMEDVSYLTDVFGPRLTKTPGYLASAKWAKEKLEAYGLENVHLEPYHFGTGWQNDFTSVHMVTPQYMPVIAYPKAWSSGTQGNVRGPAVALDFSTITSESDLAPFKGKLKNAVVFTAPQRMTPPNFEPDAVILTEEQLDAMARVSIQPQPAESKYRSSEEGYPRNKILEFLVSEGAVAITAPDHVYDDGTVMVTKVPGRLWETGKLQRPTELVMAVEHYNRVLRILEKGIDVEMTVDVKVSVFNEDPWDHNVIAEIPGTDLKDEVVMVGGHLDAHTSGTGAEDNATGAVQVMEAARILKAIGVKPRRTIRFALWGGEEMGLLGAKAYVQKHFVNPKTKGYTREHDRFSCYFNLDYGTGNIRGVYLMNNFLAKPILEKWMEPLRDMDMTHLILTPGQDISSDHIAFQAVGLPVFPFLQDPLENDSRTFHSNMDVFDKIVPECLIQGAVVVATMVYHAAMYDALLPRLKTTQR